MIAFSMQFKSIPSILSEGNFGRTFVLEMQPTKINALYCFSVSLHSAPTKSLFFCWRSNIQRPWKLPENFLPPSLIMSPLVYLFVHSFAHLQFISFVFVCCLVSRLGFMQPRLAQADLLLSTCASILYGRITAVCPMPSLDYNHLIFIFKYS